MIDELKLEWVREEEKEKKEEAASGWTIYVSWWGPWGGGRWEDWGGELALAIRRGWVRTGLRSAVRGMVRYYSVGCGEFEEEGQGGEGDKGRGGRDRRGAL